MSKIQPLSPKEIIDNLDQIIPDYVISAVNKILKTKYRGNNSVVIKQHDLITEIMKLAPHGVTTDTLFDENYLDIENLFSQYGWNVVYDQPAYVESFDAYYTFTPKK